MCLHIGNHTSNPFTLLHGTPQGSPLSPILLAFYMSALLASAAKWEHSDLLLYIDDSTIYATSATEHATTTTAIKRYKEVLQWLHRNGLQADLAKTELMTFSKKKST